MRQKISTIYYSTPIGALCRSLLDAVLEEEKMSADIRYLGRRITDLKKTQSPHGPHERALPPRPAESEVPAEWLVHLLVWMRDAGTVEHLPGILQVITTLEPLFPFLPPSAEWRVRAVCVRRAMMHTQRTSVLRACDRIAQLCELAAESAIGPCALERELEIAGRKALSATRWAVGAVRLAVWTGRAVWAAKGRTAAWAGRAAWSATKKYSWAVRAAAAYASVAGAAWTATGVPLARASWDTSGGVEPRTTAWTATGGEGREEAVRVIHLILEELISILETEKGRTQTWLHRNP